MFYLFRAGLVSLVMAFFTLLRGGQFFLFSFFALLVSCSATDRMPGHVYYRLEAEPTSLDPALIVDVPGGAISAKLFNGLVRLGEDLEVEPDIASRWNVSEDGLTYRFVLREDVTFSNGRAVGAPDFKYSFERVLSPETKSPRTWLFDRVVGAREFMSGDAGEVEGFRVVDGRTFEIRLEEPFSPFLGLLTMSNAYVVPREDVERLGPDFSARPVGTGPYVLKAWLPGDRIVLKARADYFEGSPAVRGMVYRVIPENLTAVAEFELGNLDAIGIPSSVFSRYIKSPKWKDLIISAEGLNVYYLGLNCSRPPFDNPEVRRALNLAIDRKRILDTLYEKRGRLAVGPVPGALRRWEAPEPYPYEPERARQILEKEGAVGDKVDFYVTSSPQEVVDMAEVIQAYLKDAGLDVRLQAREWSAFKEAVARGESDMFWLSWWADYPDPENFLYPLFHSENRGPGGNRAFYSNPEVDSLIEAGQRAPSMEIRDSYYGRAERIIVRDAPWVFFWHRTDYMVHQPWIEGQRMYPVYSMDKGLDVALSR
jgi:ABC-type transport system substrate-binding protein